MMGSPSTWVAGMGLVVGLGVGASWSERYTDQPFPFNHAAHVRGAACLLCHQGARTGARAGILDLVACTGCHAVPPGNPSAAQRAAWQEAEAGVAAPWNRLYRLPSQVYFSHQRHVVLAGLDCATCHGDIAQRTSAPARPRQIVKMRDCIGCHDHEKVTVDCTGCHR
jgi:c(7)-type cytochrome triheme protein